MTRVVVLALVAAAQGLAAQTTATELRAALPTEPGAVAVTVIHRLAPVEASTLAVRGVALGQARISELRVSVRAADDGGPPGPPRRLAPELSVGPGDVYRGTVELPAELAGAPGSGHEPLPLELVLTYRVSGAVAVDHDDLRYGLPVLVLGDTQAEARPGLFKAILEVPDGIGIYESFPTGFRTREGPLEGAGSAPEPGTSTVADPTGTAAAGVASVDLQVIPAVVTLRARRGGAPVLAGVRLLDALGVVALAILGIFGWRYLVREGERSDARRRDPGATGPAEGSAGPGRAP